MNAPAIAQAPTITQYDPLKAKVAELVAANRSTTFQYEDPKGNKLARSHVFQLRAVRGEIERTRVAAKADALKYGRDVDAVAKDLEKSVDDMIRVHQEPLDEIEARETQRKADLKVRVDGIVMARVVTGMTAAAISETLVKVKAITTDDMQEFQAAADRELLATIKALEEAHVSATHREAEAAELARLRAETAAREQQAREEKIRADAEQKERDRAQAQREKEIAQAAADQARRDATAKAEADRVEREAREAVAAAEKARVDAELAAAREVARVKAEAEAKEAARAKAEADKAAAEQRASENKKRRAKIHAEVADAIRGMTAEEIVEAIADGKVPRVTLTYA